MVVEVGRFVRKYVRSLSREICVCGLVGVLGEVRRKVFGFFGVGNIFFCFEY